eukprot:6607843-Ditylum_brightwellii.AAC.1
MPVGLSHGHWIGHMKSSCDGHNGTFGVNNSLIILLGVCTKLVVDKNGILGACGGGDCAGACMGG